MSTCHRMDLQTVGSQPIMPKILPDHIVCNCRLHVSPGQPNFRFPTSVPYMLGNVRGEPVSSVMAAGRFCEKSG